MNFNLQNFYLMKKNNKIKIGKKTIGDKKKIFLIGDIGLTHKGDIEIIFKMIDFFSLNKVDAIKMQLIGPEFLFGDKNVTHTYKTLKDGLITQNMIEMTSELNLKDEEWYKIAKYIRKKKMEFICTSHYLGAVDILEKCNVNIHKICTWSTNHKRMIQKMGSTGKPLMIDLGASDVNDVDNIYKWHKNSGGKGFLVLHDFHTENFNEMNFKSIPFIKKRYNCPVGYTPQGRDSKLDFLSVGMGINMIEKRLTLDRSTPKNGHWKALEPNEFINWIRDIKNLEKALGSETIKPTKTDIKQSKKYFKSIYSSREIKKGQKLNDSNLKAARPGTGIPVNSIDDILGKKAKKNIKKNKIILKSMIF